MGLATNAQLVIIRGLPGSGKSTLAKEIAQRCDFVHFESDMFFQNDDCYVFEKNKLTRAQRWCFKEVSEALLLGKKVVVSNVFTQLMHMEKYMALTDAFVVIECNGDYGSVHEVPDAVVRNMRASWQAFEGAVVI